MEDRRVDVLHADFPGRLLTFPGWVGLSDRKPAAKAAAAEEQARRDQELKFLDKILALFRELLATAMGKSQGT